LSLFPGRFSVKVGRRIVKIEDIPQFLGKVRADRAAWSEVECVHFSSGEDINAPARHACLRGLQYDSSSNDRELTIFLLEQEVRDCCESKFGGYDDHLFLAVYLVACLDEVDLAWLIMEAKLANFDTWHGVDIEALYGCGVERTLAMLKASQREEGESFLPAPDQANVDRWWKRQRSRFPARWEDEINKIDICAAIGDSEAAAEYLRKQVATSVAEVESGSKQERELLADARRQWRNLGATMKQHWYRKNLTHTFPMPPGNIQATRCPHNLHCRWEAAGGGKQDRTAANGIAAG
jgi:hypothetical protein